MAIMKNGNVLMFNSCKKVSLRLGKVQGFLNCLINRPPIFTNYTIKKNPFSGLYFYTEKGFLFYILFDVLFMIIITIIKAIKTADVLVVLFILCFNIHLLFSNDFTPKVLLFSNKHLHPVIALFTISNPYMRIFWLHNIFPVSLAVHPCLHYFLRCALPFSNVFTCCFIC